MNTPIQAAHRATGDSTDLIDTPTVLTDSESPARPAEAVGSSNESDTANVHSPSGGGGVPALTLVLFVVGCVVLVVAAVATTHLNEWMDRWGTVPVFLVFFLVMSIAGRWFWAGADAIVSAIRGKGGDER